MRKTAIGTLRWALVVILAAGGLVIQPVAAVAAQGANDPGTPPTGEWGSASLERAWLRQQRALNRLGFMFDHSSQRRDNAQEFIDTAKAQGRDVEALQASLDAFSGAMIDAQRSYEVARGILNDHKGFDSGGEVVDRDLALATVEEMAQELEAIRGALLQPSRDLRDALRDFRKDHRPTGP